MEGLEGVDYGPWHVSIRREEVFGLRSTSAAGEVRTSHPVPAGQGVYYHHGDYLAAKRR